MPASILIDMIKIRTAMVNDSTLTLPDAYLYHLKHGLKTIRELAIFRFTCRRCEDAPCISVCPAEALEKDDEGIIERHSNLCISCKSCVTICPFGTMMTDFFRYHMNMDLLYDLKNEVDVENFIKACPEGTVVKTDMNECPEKNVYRLNENVLIRDYLYVT